MRAKTSANYKKSCDDLERRVLGRVPEKKVKSVNVGRNCECTSKNFCEPMQIVVQKIREELRTFEASRQVNVEVV